MSVSMLREVVDAIAVPLSASVNECLRSGNFPDFLKTSRTVPVFKKGDRENLRSFRPISITPVFGKVIEAVIKPQLEAFFEENGLFSNMQFGFRVGRSTVGAVDHVAERIDAAFEDGESLALALCDLSRAFDCVDHGILLRKLSFYGLRDSALSILGFYLSGRTQLVSLSGADSRTLPVTFGVPQGLVLGPTLFLVMINDLDDHGSSLMFADDASLLSSGAELERVLEASAEHLQSATSWFLANRFQLNEDKTQRIICSLSREPRDPQNPVKLLGFVLDSKLSWNSHIQQVTSRLSRICFLLLKMRGLVTEKYLIMMYHALFHCHITYGLLLWGHSAGAADVLRLQKRAIRIITGSDHLAHCKPIFARLGVLTVFSHYILLLIGLIKFEFAISIARTKDTSSQCSWRRSLFTAPDVSPIRNGTNSKRNSATNIVSKIPVKLPTKIPLLRRQTKTSEPEKPVLKTKLNNDQTDASGKIKNEKENKSPKLPSAGKEAANKSSNSSTSNKKNTAENVSKMEWDTLEVLSVQVFPPVSKEKSNLEIDLDDDDDGDFQFSKKGKKNISNKKSPNTKKAKGADKKPAKSARGKKKETAEETEAAPEETKINSKIQLDGDGANKVAESRRVLKKGPNKDQKKPAARNKRKAADSKLDPVEELNDAEDEKRASTRNKRKTLGGDLETIAEEAIHAEDQTKSPTKNRRRTFDLGPIAEEPKTVVDEVKSPPRNKRETADSDVTPVTEEPKNDDDKKPAKSTRGKKKETAEEAEAAPEDTPEETRINSKIHVDRDGANKVAETRRVLKKGPNKDQKKPAARNKRKAADSKLDPVEELNDAEDEKRASTRNKRKTLGGDLETIAEEAIHDEDQTKSPTKNRRRTFDLGPIAEEPKTVEDEVKSPPRNKRKTADSDVTTVTEESKNDDDEKPAKSTRGKKKETAEEAEAAPDNTPEETRINSKIHVDRDGANKVAETRRVLKKGPNKDQKKPAARNKRKAADSKLDPVEELNDAEDQTKSPTKNRRRTFELGPIAEGPKKVEDEVKSPPRNKRKTADSDVTPVTEEPKNVDAAQTTKTVKAEKMGTDQEDGDCQLPVEASKEESEEASNVDDKALKESESEVAPKRKRKKKNEEDVKEVSAAFSEIGEKGQENSDAKEPEAEPKNEIEPEVVPKRKRKQKNEVDVKEVSAAFSEIGEKESKPKVVPKNKRKKKNEEDVKEISAAFSEMGEKEEENVEAKEPEAEPKTGTEVEPRRRTRKVAQKTVPKMVREPDESTKSETVTETSKGSEKKSDQQNASKKQEMMSKPSTSKLKLPADMPAPSSSLTVRSSNTSGVEKQILMNSIFGSPANTNSKPSKPVEVFRSLKPSDNVMGGFISMIPSSIHSGLATNYNMYFLSTDTLLKVNTCGMERVIGKHTSFIIPKESRFCFENVGEETAILSFTKLRSI
ncbi:titin [Nilaparvata lugens]|uniref:titin n=1 Tax=Nilaparvata lugens TaxID=108931 RepID=UPI00193E0C41|nr:titin [Nilaparvata lugens]